MKEARGDVSWEMAVHFYNATSPSVIQGCSSTSVMVKRLSTSRSSILRTRSMQASEKGRKGMRRGWSRISSTL